MAGMPKGVLCPQSYSGMEMEVVPCDKCSVGWNEAKNRCTAETGVPPKWRRVPADQVPTCPIQKHCRHQMQEQGPCIVRSVGLICESALILDGLSSAEAMMHPLSFHADYVDPDVE